MSDEDQTLLPDLLPDHPTVEVEEVPEEEDVFQDPIRDPWNSAGAPSRQTERSGTAGPSEGLRRGMAGRLPQHRPSFAAVTLPVQDGGTSQRIIHDVPPVWDGKDPDNMAEPYLKLLRGWLSTTRTLNTQRGMTILHYAAGDLKLIINELDVDILTAADSGNTVFIHVQKAYAEYIVKKLPKAIEKSLFDPNGHRSGGESMLQYI